MIIKRQIEIVYDSEKSAVDNSQIKYAIGYLVSWASYSERYCKVKVCIGDNFHPQNINARYFDKDNNMTYEIGGIVREDGTYSFHS